MAFSNGKERSTPEQSGPRITVRCPRGAAEVLGVSEDHFARWIQPELRTIKRGRLTLVSLRELQTWADKSAARWGDR